MADTHKHQCLDCNTIWEHANSCRNASSELIFKLAHMCPKCGRAEYHHYLGPNKPSHRGTCQRPELAQPVVRVAHATFV